MIVEQGNEAVQYVDLPDEEFGQYLQVVLAEQFTKPGTANVSAKDKLKLKGLLAHYMKMAHPFSACKRDQIKHGLSEDHANRRCAVLKDVGTGTTKWRGKDSKKAATDAGEAVVLTLDVPEGWQEEFARELADVVSVEPQPEDPSTVVLAEGPESYLSRFLQAYQSANTAVGAEAKQPELNSPEQAADWFSRLGEWIRSTMRMGKVGYEPYLSEQDAGAVEDHPPGRPGHPQVHTVAAADDLFNPANNVAASTATAGSSTNLQPGTYIGTSNGGLEVEHHHGYLTPLVSLSDTQIELGADGKKAFWKQILPLGKAIKYGKGMLRTDKAFLQKLADNINSGKFPAPFVAVNSKNEHDETPEQARGMVKAARLTKHGLDVKLEPRTPEAEKFLTDFPEVPVSAFYDEDYTDRGTGEHIGPRLFHVAATWRPYVNGMSPMELVAAADAGAEVVDLTGAEYADPVGQGKEAEVPEGNASGQQREEVELNEEQQGQQDSGQQVAASDGNGNVVSLTPEQWQEYERRLAAAEATAEAERFARLSERTLSFLRGKYPNASEAQVRAAHTLLTAPGDGGQYAVQLTDTGEVKLADKEKDARGDLITTLLDGCNSAPALTERGADGDVENRPVLDAAREEARKRAEAEGKPYRVALSEVMNERAASGEVNI